jgi:hypothetical protein
MPPPLAVGMFLKLASIAAHAVLVFRFQVAATADVD